MPDRFPSMVLVDGYRKQSGVEVHYSMAVGTSAQAADRLRDVGELLLILRERGGFAAQGAEPSDADDPVGLEVRQCAPGELIQSLPGAQLDFRSLQCLRNMSRRLRLHDVLVNKIGVFTGVPGDRERELAWLTDWDEQSAYPQLAPYLQPILNWEDADFGKSRRCLIELDRSLEGARVVEFERWVTPWFDCLEAGAYAVPVGWPEDCECIRGDVSQFDDKTIEVSMVRFEASEQAWIALANMAAHFWQGSCAVVRILVD